MPATVTITEAQASLPNLIAGLRPGEEVVITQNEEPVAKLVRSSMGQRRPRRPGSAKGKLVILVEDEEHLKDFEDYMG